MIQRNLANIVDVLKRDNRKLFIGLNWWNSPGYMLAEIDYISRMFKMDKPLSDSRPLLVLNPTDATSLAAKALANSQINVEILSTEYAFQVQREIAVFYPELVIRAGFWDFRIPETVKPNHEHNLYFLHCDNYEQHLNFYLSLIKAHHKTANFSLYKNYAEQVLSKKIEKIKFIEFLKQSPYIAIQCNSREKFSDGFEKLLSLIMDQGYRIIMCGREEYPEIFHNYNVYDYPRSEYCSYENDFLLAANAASGLIWSGGLGRLYDLLGIECLVLGDWKPWPYYRKTTTLLPRQIKHRTSDVPLNFVDQIDAVKNIIKPGADIPGSSSFDGQDEYSLMPIEPDFIFQSFKEILLPAEKTYITKEMIRNRVRNDDETSLWKFSNCYLPSLINEYYADYLN